MTRVRHLLTVLGYIVQRPHLAWRGAREYRSDVTEHFEDLFDLECYDAGRELAHMLTRRRYDNAA